MSGELFTVPEESRDMVPADGRAISTASEVGGLLRLAIDKDLDADKLEKIIALYNQQEDRQRKDAFDMHFGQMQKELPIIKKGKEVRGRDGKIKFTYAPIEDLKKLCDNIIHNHGFTYSFDEETNEDKSKTALLYFSGWGHTRRFSFNVPYSAPNDWQTEGQSAVGQSTTAARMVFARALGLTLEDEDNLGQIEVPEDVQKIFDAMTAEKDIKKLLPIFQDAYKKYEKEPNKQLLISGRYAQVKAAIIQGGN
jgi:hypothetical protein